MIFGAIYSHDDLDERDEHMWRRSGAFLYRLYGAGVHQPGNQRTAVSRWKLDRVRFLSAMFGYGLGEHQRVRRELS